MIGLNLLGNSYLGPSLSWSDLLAFTLLATILIMILSWCYSRIKIKNGTVEPVRYDIPIYQTRDILLQEKNLGLEVIPSKKATSIWVKAITFILIFLVAVTPLYQLLRGDYFL
ncbi:conserved protein of unknown function [Tenacibaculum sp. 190130A14a]|uniref:Uncharacterized protein n=1 Tax=Tenacibaculum polynesiense TaxID=3137857 RepID=A0ABM9PE62_9FLAO